MNRLRFFLISTLFMSSPAFAHSFAGTDSFTYTIDLDRPQNIYLRSVPVDLLKGFCKGDWNAYYPLLRKNQCLFDDFLEHFDASQPDTLYCADELCNDPSLAELFHQFSHQLRYCEVYHYDSAHALIKREVLWLQTFYSLQNAGVWKHYNGPIFWMGELHPASGPIMISNLSLRHEPWSLQAEFEHPMFIVDENRSGDNLIKVSKYDDVEEH